MALSTPFFLCSWVLVLCTYYTQLIFKSPQKELANKKNKNEIWFVLIGYESQLHAYLMNSKFKVSFPHCIGAKNKSSFEWQTT